MKSKLCFLILLSNLTLQLTAQDVKIFHFEEYLPDGRKPIKMIYLYTYQGYLENLIPNASQEMLAENSYLQSYTLEHQGITFSKNDKIFVYDTLRETIKIIDINKLNIIACRLTGDNDDPLYAIYGIGFEWTKDFSGIVSIGRKNPFIKRKLHKIAWKEVEQEDFPNEEFHAIDTVFDWHCNQSPWCDDYKPGKVYKYEREGLSYLIKNLGPESDAAVRFLVVVDKNNGTILFHDIDFNDEFHNLNEVPYTWTGKLFKGKPRIIFGFKNDLNFYFLDNRFPPVVIPISEDY